MKATFALVVPSHSSANKMCVCVCSSWFEVKACAYEANITIKPFSLSKGIEYIPGSAILYLVECA